MKASVITQSDHNAFVGCMSDTLMLFLSKCQLWWKENYIITCYHFGLDNLSVIALLLCNNEKKKSVSGCLGLGNAVLRVCMIQVKEIVKIKEKIMLLEILYVTVIG